jgi:hypothetical protein
METLTFKSGDYGEYPVLFTERRIVSGGGHRLRSFEIHKLMVWRIIKVEAAKFGKPSNIECSFENDRGVAQFVVTCDFAEGTPQHKVGHYRQDFFTLIDNRFSLKWFRNVHDYSFSL